MCMCVRVCVCVCVSVCTHAHTCVCIWVMHVHTSALSSFDRNGFDFYIRGTLLTKYISKRKVIN